MIKKFVPLRGNSKRNSIMKEIKEKSSTKNRTAKAIAYPTEKKRLSAIAKYWATVDSNDWEIVDMRAVLR
jgi:hypothetical protein